MSDVITPSWGIPITMVDMAKIKVRAIAENNGDSEIYEIYYEDEENGHLYFALPPATMSYSQISPMQALQSSKFPVTLSFKIHLKRTIYVMYILGKWL